MRAYRGLFLQVLAIMLLCPWSQARPLVVGVYENEPKVYTDAQGRASGLFIDLLREIAARQDWQLEFVPCHWVECLQALNEGGLDLMPDVAYSEARALVFDFHRQPALNSWSQLYSRSGSSLVSFLQLEGQRVVVLDGSIQQSAFREMMTGFGVKLDLVTAPSYAMAFQLVRDGEADAAVTNHLYGSLYASQFGLVETPIVFQPSALFYATGRGRNADVLAAIDDQLNEWRQEVDSTYFQVLARWQSLPPKPLIPPSLLGALAVVVLVLCVSLGVLVGLRRQVALRTRDLRTSETKLAAILDNVGAFIYIKDRDQRYTYANKKLLEGLGLTEKEVIGKVDSELLGVETAREIARNDHKVLLEGRSVTAEEPLYYGNLQGTYVSAKIPLRDSLGQIYGLCGISTDITEQKQREQKIHYLAYHDAQTGLPNRAYMIDHLTHLVSEPPAGTNVALLVLDLDHFKNINDIHGHKYGNELLSEVAGRLQALQPPDSHLIHLGADEFVIFLPNLAFDRAEAFLRDLCHKILVQLRQRYEWQEFTYHCSVSIGYAFLTDQSEERLDVLLKHAELAMHQAKKAGRNQACLFTPAMQALLRDRLQLETDLGDGLTRQQFFLLYQVQVDENANAIGAEALLRWDHPHRGTVSPSEFVPLAESTGLIASIGRWVLRAACVQLARWQQEPAMAALTLSVNISPRQFRSDDFTETLKAILAETEAPAARLKLEMTETILIEDLDDAIDKITALNALGVQVSLDDFGTGYSSLAYLKRLPLSQLKIDQSFVADVLNNPVAGSIARTIIGLGKSLDLNVIAEGVETEAQKHWLAAAGCHAYQGFLFGRPVSADDFVRSMAGHSGAQTKPNTANQV